MMTCWDLETWKSFKKIEEPHNEISALDFSHDGRIFATAGKVGHETCNIIITHGMSRFVLHWVLEENRKKQKNQSDTMVNVWMCCAEYN